eukprot:2036317-Amphidinium_carterae.1
MAGGRAWGPPSETAGADGTRGCGCGHIGGLCEDHQPGTLPWTAVGWSGCNMLEEVPPSG